MNPLLYSKFGHLEQVTTLLWAELPSLEQDESNQEVSLPGFCEFFATCLKDPNIFITLEMYLIPEINNVSSLPKYTLSFEK